MADRIGPCADEEAALAAGWCAQVDVAAVVVQPAAPAEEGQEMGGGGGGAEQRLGWRRYTTDAPDRV